MGFFIEIDPKAIEDIQNAIEYYDEKQLGLGEKFEQTLHKHFTSLQKNPFFEVRYDEVHCLPIKKFPYMAHFTINQNNKGITIRAVFNTSLNPKKWENR